MWLPFISSELAGQADAGLVGGVREQFLELLNCRIGMVSIAAD